MNNSKSLLIGGGALLLVAAGAGIWLSRPASPVEKAAPVLAETRVERERPKPQAAAGGGGQAVEGNPAANPAANPSPELTVEQKQIAEKEREAVLVILDEAATTYDPAQLGVIDKYLYHADPEIRKTAMDSMVVLGDSGAGKLLRKAAESASDPKEKEALVAAAEYMELPPLDTKALAERIKKSGNKPAGELRFPGIGKSAFPAPSQEKSGTNPGLAPPAAPAPAPVPSPAPGQ